MMKGQPGHKRFSKIGGNFTWQLIEMIESPAYRVLSLAARRLLNRIEIELAHHGGNDNGRLPVTYDDFVKYGIDRHAIAPAMREVEALGFVRVPVRGRGGNADFRRPNHFRLTYRHTADAPATDDWRRIKTVEDAEAIAREARAPSKKQRRAKNKKPVGETLTETSVGNPHRKPKFPVGETHTTGPVGKPTLLSISWVGARPRTLSHISEAKNSGRKIARAKVFANDQ